MSYKVRINSCLTYNSGKKICQNCEIKSRNYLFFFFFFYTAAEIGFHSVQMYSFFRGFYILIKKLCKQTTCTEEYTKDLGCILRQL